MPRLPRVTGRSVVRALQALGFEIFDQSGSHVYLHRWTGVGWYVRVTVPVHAGRILKLRTLSNILKQADISPEELIRHL